MSVSVLFYIDFYVLAHWHILFDALDFISASTTWVCSLVIYFHAHTVGVSYGCLYCSILLGLTLIQCFQVTWALWVMYISSCVHELIVVIFPHPISLMSTHPNNPCILIYPSNPCMLLSLTSNDGPLSLYIACSQMKNNLLVFFQNPFFLQMLIVVSDLFQISFIHGLYGMNTK